MIARLGPRTLLAVGLVTASACSVLGPDLDRLDSQTGQAAAAVHACSVRPPPPTTTSSANSPGSGDRTILTVFTSLELLPPTDPRGFDLDDRCTCPEPPSCRGSGDTNTCDTGRSIDNALGAALQSIPGASLLLDTDKLHRHFADGESNIIVYVTGYNGADNDNDVLVYIMRSTGTPFTGPTHVLPKFDGADPFDCVGEDVATCNPSGIIPATAPQHGYVRDRLLVLPNGNFFLSFIAGYPMHARGTMTARIESFAPGPGGEPRYALRGGILAGALPFADLLQALALVESAPGTPLCSQPGVMAFLKNQICAAQDITFAPAPALAAAPAGALPSCDAVSAVVAFEAVPFVPHEAPPLPPAVTCTEAALLKCD